jgi:hypothetical protein
MQPTIVDPAAARERIAKKLPPERRGPAKAESLKQTAVKHIPIWQPNPDHEDGRPNTQRLALESKADILGISGTAGWGKTDLALGLAVLEHNRTVIFRRIFKNLRGIIERSREIYNPEGASASDDRFNEQLHRWVLKVKGKRKIVEFEAMQYETDKFHQRGRDRDLMVFDEATEFSKAQIEFTLGWMRSTKKGQRCRALLPFNPPTDSIGTWVIDYFLPWIAYLFPQKFSHPNPAAPGELRWYTTLDNGEEIERPNGEPFEQDGKTYTPLSRSFLFGTLEDNPHLYSTNYRSILAAMPEPLRSQLLYGDFAADSKADPWQVIPTAWVKEAQRRWMEMGRPDMPCSGVGVDLVRGGKDFFALSKRYGTWFDEIIKVAGVDVEDGPKAAALVHEGLKDETHIGYINVDVIGVGSSGYDSLKAMPAYANITNPITAGAASDYLVYTVVNGVRVAVFSMSNVRAEYYWRLREALDPEHGDGVALPPGNELVRDLCSAKYEVMAGSKTAPPKIKIELKKEIKKRLGHSPDAGEAVMMANLRPVDNTVDWQNYQHLGKVDEFTSRWK